jgi:predicted O-methyltransferase YrrM
VAIEIGSFEGRSTLWILENLLRHPSSRLYCVDTFQAEIEARHQAVDAIFDTFSKNVQESEGREKVIVSKGASKDFLARLMRDGVCADFIYVDGSHRAPMVLLDLVMGFSLLKVGGLMICDDYLWSMERPRFQDVLNSPKISIDAFTTIYRRQIEILPKQALYQLAFIKSSECAP